MLARPARSDNSCASCRPPARRACTTPGAIRTPYSSRPLPSPGSRWQLRGTPATHQSVNAALQRLSVELPLIAPAVYSRAGQAGAGALVLQVPQDDLGSGRSTSRRVVFSADGHRLRWTWAKRTGVVFFGVAFALHTVAGGVRWYLAGRIPNSNMFEAVTAAAWFGAAIALVLEAGPALARRRFTWTLGGIAALGGLLAYLVGVPAQGASFDDWQAWGAVPTAGLILLAGGLVLLVALVVARRRGSGTGSPCCAPGWPA